MNAIDAENDAALAEVYENDLADGGKQAESVEIDGVPIFGNLDFDPTTVELVFGGTKRNITATFYTLKRYFPNGYAKVLNSRATAFVGGRVVNYQVRQINGDLDNRAQVAFGLAADHNQK